MSQSSKYFADVSSNNSSFNAREYASAGHNCISIKATEGVGYTNPEYQPWIQASHNHGLHVFHYHFGRPEHGEPHTEAEHFWNHVHPHFRRKDYIVLDLETGNPGQGAAWAREYEKHLIQISGNHMVLYTYLSYFHEGGVTTKSGMIWMAAYGSRQPPFKLGNNQILWAWQYTDGNGYGPGPQRFAGIPGTSDGSILNSRTVRELASRR